MSFFTKSDGTEIAQTTSFENSGVQELIPDGTQLHANILEAMWQDETQYTNQHILLSWYITEKGKYNGFIVKQKIHVFDNKPSKADKAKEMLMAIDTNCKGLITKAAQVGKFVIGDSGQLARALCGGSALITVSTYSMESTTINQATGELYPTRTGNWVRAVSPVAKKQAAEDRNIKKQAETKAPDLVDDYDTEIPF